MGSATVADGFAAIPTPAAHIQGDYSITAYLKNGGRLEIAQQIAAQESPRTTGLYDRRSDDVSRLDEIERIVLWLGWLALLRKELMPKGKQATNEAAAAFDAKLAAAMEEARSAGLSAVREFIQSGNHG
jgi:hypothetical protein